MKRNEFIADLKEALEHNLSEQKIKEHVDYYEEYIRNEVKSGRTEEEVVNELGDPWAIAKTIRLSEGMESQETVHQTPEEPAQSEVKRSWNWKAILTIVVLGVIVLSLLSAFMGILGLVIRYAYPILIIVIVLRIMKRR